MSSRADRERHVTQMLANFRLEGIEPDAADKQLQSAYIEGAATLDDLHNYAIEFAVGRFVDDGRAAKEHLAAGRPIIYIDDSVSESYLIRQWPDGRLELIDVDDQGNIKVLGPQVTS